MCYTSCMDDKPLIETNPYLIDPIQCQQLLVLNVSTSTAVELRKIPAMVIKAIEEEYHRLFIKTPK